ncbi:MAG: hypothetical protein HY456_00460 [Parcubacteria group bacterium]|nr:hypothetical protein [Parcubacteria group bacterium]
MNKISKNIAIAVAAVAMFLSTQAAFASIPDLDFHADDTSITRGEWTMLSWDSDGTDCWAKTGWSGYKSPSGSQPIAPLVTTKYRLTCFDNGSDSDNVTDTVTVFVDSPDSDEFNQTGSNNGGTAGTSNRFTAACVIEPSVATIGQKVDFAAGFAGAVEPVRYKWSGDIFGTAQLISTSFSTIGTKVAQLTVTDDAGKTATASCSAQVNPKPVFVTTSNPTPITPTPKQEPKPAPKPEPQPETPPQVTVIEPVKEETKPSLLASLLFNEDRSPRFYLLFLFYTFLTAILGLFLYHIYMAISRKHKEQKKAPLFQKLQ